MAKDTFMGFRRANGQVGVRNLVVVMSAMDNINPVARAICRLVPQAVPLTIVAGRGQYGKDDAQTLRTMIGLGCNPNVYGLVVVSLEQTAGHRIADAIAERSGKPVVVVDVQSNSGTLNATVAGARAAAEMLVEASRLQREECPLSDLLLSVECGGTDTTSGLAANPVCGMVADHVVDCGGGVMLSEISELLGTEDMLAERAVSKEVADRVYEVIYRVESEAKRRGCDIRGANPVPDNIRGGITTIEEKSLGGMVKGGTRPLCGVLDYACAPAGKGMYLMETPAPAVESLTGLAAGGSQLAIFTTGVGNTSGHPLLPCIKITANPKTAVNLRDNIDFSLPDVLTGEESFDSAYERLLQQTIDTASGMMVKAEIFEQVENGNAKIEATV